MNKEEKLKDLLTKIETLKPDLDFQIKYTARKAAEHTTEKERLGFLKDQIKEYRDRMKKLEVEE